MVVSIQTCMLFIFLQYARSDKLFVIGQDISFKNLSVISMLLQLFLIGCSFFFHLVTRILHLVNYSSSRYLVMTSCYLLVIPSYLWLRLVTYLLFLVTSGYVWLLNCYFWLLLVTSCYLLVISSYFWLCLVT